jgi:RNA polymerase-binding transcription factor
MPSKKPNKAAKRPGKATIKKATTKAAAPTKKTAKPQPKPTPIATSKVKVKQPKPNPKTTVAKPSPAVPTAKAAAAKPTAVKTPRVTGDNEIAGAAAEHAETVETSSRMKFDPRPMVMSRVVQPEDDVDPDSASSLLAGPRNVKPYITRRGEQYMNKEQLEHFARILQSWKRDLMVEVDRTVLHMKDEAANFPDPNDRATQEEEFSLELRTRDRERKLIRKIDEALKRIEDGSYGYCLETGEEIGIKRLEARPVATLSVEAQERRERREKQYGDRDDRYR